MKYKNLSLHSKIFLKIISLTFLIFGVLILINVYKESKIAINNAKILIELKSKEYANINKSEFEKVLYILKTFGATYNSFDYINEKERRLFVNQCLIKILETNPEIIGIGFICEQNAIDGLDSNFINNPGCSKTGRYIPYLCKINGKYAIQKSENYETASWYLECKKKLLESFEEPTFKSINNKEILISTVCIPLFSDGAFYGVFYANISLEKIVQLNNQLKIFNTGYGQLISSQGIILSHPNKKFVNQVYESYKDKKIEFVEAINNGKSLFVIENSAQTANKVYKSIVPIIIGNSTNPLSFVLTVPYSEIIKPALLGVYQTIFYVFISFVLLTVFAFLIIKKATKPIKYALQAIDSIATTGRIDKLNSGIVFSNDEIGKMFNSINKLVEELNIKTDFANEIKNGKLDTTYHSIGKDDILGNSLLEVKQSLIKSSEEEIIRKQEDEKRNWAAEGLTKFAEILRKNNNNVETLSYELIKNLVKYIKANQGGVFLINEENTIEPFLELTACFAYDRQKFLNKKVLIGEGLIGSCYLEKKSIYLTNIPKSYINISSGLGDSNPSAILIVPLKLNEENYGVIELASFEKIEKYQIDFIEKVTEIIASTISSVKINMKTAFLLTQSQEQAEEMKAQEEEMRQNMEELTATQESLADKDFIKQKEIDRLTKLIDEKNSELKIKEEENNNKVESIYLEFEKYKTQFNILKKENPLNENSINFNEDILNSFANILINKDTVVISFNDMFLKLIEREESIVMGIKFVEIFKCIDNKESFTNNLLSNINKGHLFTENILLSSIGNEDIWIKAVFYPFSNNKKEINNIFVIFYEVTEDVKLKNLHKKQIFDLKSQIELLKEENSKSIASEVIADEYNSDNIAIIDILNKAFIKEEYLTDGEIINVNDHFEKSYGYQKNEVEGTNIISLIPDKSRKEFKMIWESLMRGSIFKGETSRLSKTGNEIWLSSIYYPIIAESKKIQKIIFLAVDNSDSKNLEKENQKLVEKVKELENEYKKNNIQSENLKKGNSKKNFKNK